MNITAIKNGWLVTTANCPGLIGSSFGEGFFCATREEVAEYVKTHLQTKPEIVDNMHKANLAEHMSYELAARSVRSADAVPFRRN